MKKILAGSRKISLKRSGWSDSVCSVKYKAKFAIVTADNHYADFTPATAKTHLERWSA
jgi:hypothetical protein